MTYSNGTDHVIAPSHWRKPFFTIWIGQAVSLLGSSLAQFVLIWRLTQISGSAAVLAGAGFVALFPNVVLGPFAGALVDRWNRRSVMMVADGMIAVASAVLIALFWVGTAQVWHIYVILFIRAVGGAFHWPAMQSAVSLMVPEDQLLRVAGANQALRGISDITAPAIGALMLGLLPIHAILMIDVGTAGIAISLLAVVHIPEPQLWPRDGSIELRGVVRDVVDGVRFLLSWPGACVAMLLSALVGFLVTPAQTLLPLLVMRELHGDVWQLGLSQSSFGAGVVLGGLVLGVWGGFHRRMVTGLLSLIGLGVGIALVGVSPAGLPGLLVIGMFTSGFMLATATCAMLALLQVHVPAIMQGRMFTLLQSGIGALGPLSMLVSGPVAELLGVRAWFLIGGCACLCAGVLGLCLPSVSRIEEMQPSA
jgi:DHA3 family macrolide efflux protein-like MFS transporter